MLLLDSPTSMEMADFNKATPSANSIINPTAIFDTPETSQPGFVPTIIETPTGHLFSKINLEKFQLNKNKAKKELGNQRSRQGDSASETAGARGRHELRSDPEPISNPEGNYLRQEPVDNVNLQPVSTAGSGQSLARPQQSQTTNSQRSGRVKTADGPDSQRSRSRPTVFDRLSRGNDDTPETGVSKASAEAVRASDSSVIQTTANTGYGTASFFSPDPTPVKTSKARQQLFQTEESVSNAGRGVQDMVQHDVPATPGFPLRTGNDNQPRLLTKESQLRGASTKTNSEVIAPSNGARTRQTNRRVESNSEGLQTSADSQSLLRHGTLPEQRSGYSSTRGRDSQRSSGNSQDNSGSNFGSLLAKHQDAEGTVAGVPLRLSKVTSENAQNQPILLKHQQRFFDSDTAMPESPLPSPPPTPKQSLPSSQHSPTSWAFMPAQNSPVSSRSSSPTRLSLSQQQQDPSVVISPQPIGFRQQTPLAQSQLSVKPLPPPSQPSSPSLPRTSPRKLPERLSTTFDSEANIPKPMPLQRDTIFSPSSSAFDISVSPQKTPLEFFIRGPDGAYRINPNHPSSTPFKSAKVLVKPADQSISTGGGTFRPISPHKSYVARTSVEAQATPLQSSRSRSVDASIQHDRSVYSPQARRRSDPGPATLERIANIEFNRPASPGKKIASVFSGLPATSSAKKHGMSTGRKTGYAIAALGFMVGSGWLSALLTDSVNRLLWPSYYAPSNTSQIMMEGMANFTNHTIEAISSKLDYLDTSINRSINGYSDMRDAVILLSNMQRKILLGHDNIMKFQEAKYRQNEITLNYMRKQWDAFMQFNRTLQGLARAVADTQKIQKGILTRQQLMNEEEITSRMINTRLHQDHQATQDFANQKLDLLLSHPEEPVSLTNYAIIQNFTEQLTNIQLMLKRQLLGVKLLKVKANGTKEERQEVHNELEHGLDIAISHARTHTPEGLPVVVTTTTERIISTTTTAPETTTLLYTTRKYYHLPEQPEQTTVYPHKIEQVRINNATKFVPIPDLLSSTKRPSYPNVTFPADTLIPLSLQQKVKDQKILSKNEIQMLADERIFPFYLQSYLRSISGLQGTVRIGRQHMSDTTTLRPSTSSRPPSVYDYMHVYDFM